MPSGRMPIPPEVLELMDRMERDPSRRFKLATSWEIYREAVAEGIIDADGFDWFATCMEDLQDEGLIDHRGQTAGVIAPARWNSNWVQLLHDWRVTSKGRADASLYRREMEREPGTTSPVEASQPTVGQDGQADHSGRRVAGGETDLLVRIYEADRLWAERGQDDRSFLLLHTGGMQRALQHPGWDESWPTPTSREIDDLGELGLLRVEPHAANAKNRTFELSAHGRRDAEALAEPLDGPDMRTSNAPASMPPSLDDVLRWFAALDETVRLDGQRLMTAGVGEFGAAHREAVSKSLLDLLEEGFIRFTHPTGRLPGLPASTRINKGSDFRMTTQGTDRVSRPPSVSVPPTVNVYGNVGQLAGRDIVTNITITQEMVKLALQELDRRHGLDDATRETARSLIEKAKGRTMDVLVGAAGTDAGAAALEVVRHALRAVGVTS